MTDKYQYAIETLDQLESEVGRSVYDHAIKTKNRRRLENGIGREKRKSFAWSKYQYLYRKQNGICRWCEKEMVLLRGKVEIDHRDPNSKEDFNSDSNLQLLHSHCNREKSAMPIEEQAKHLGRTYRKILTEE